MCCGINCQEDIDSIVSTSFPSDYDGIIVQRDIKCYSMCPHHLLPVEYNINIAYIPNKKMLGISKLTRIVELLAKAPKLQEQYTYDIINVLKKWNVKEPWFKYQAIIYAWEQEGLKCLMLEL